MDARLLKFDGFWPSRDQYWKFQVSPAIQTVPFGREVAFGLKLTLPLAPEFMTSPAKRTSGLPRQRVG